MVDSGRFFRGGGKLELTFPMEFCLIHWTIAADLRPVWNGGPQRFKSPLGPFLWGHSPFQSRPLVWRFLRAQKIDLAGGRVELVVGCIIATISITR